MADNNTPSGSAGTPEPDTAREPGTSSGAGDAGVCATWGSGTTPTPADGVSDASEAGTGSGADGCTKTSGGTNGGDTGIGTTADSSSTGTVISLGANL